MKRIAFLGFGGRASGFVENFRKLDLLDKSVQCVGVYDIMPEHAKAMCKNVGVVMPVFDSAQAMKDATKPDAIMIASYDNAHLDCFKAAASWGLPIMIEKPLEATPSRARELANIAATCTAPVLMAHNMRFAPIIQRAKQLLDQDAIGRVNSFRFENNVHYGHIYFRKWMRLRANVGDILVEKGSHDLDILHMLTGSRTKSVYARSKRYEYGGERENDLHCSNCPDRNTCKDAIHNFMFKVEGTTPDIVKNEIKDDLCVYAKEIDVTDDSFCMLELDNGVQGTYTQTLYTPRSYKSRIYTLVGSLGMLEIDLGEFNGEIRRYPRYGSKHEIVTETFDYQKRHHYNADLYLTQHFHDVIHGVCQPACTIADGLAAVEATAAAVRSVELDKTIMI